MSNRVLVLFAHPSLHRSEANRPLLRATAALEQVTVVDLYAEYPDFRIDIDREQQRLRDHEIVVFMFPLYWYSTPSILTEWQDLVYREDPDLDAPPNPALEARQDETSIRARAFDSTMLFRYSALTFNGHRIHYDEDYAKSVEGYDGLVVHGPLLAQLLMLMAEEEMGPLASFSFRATSALMHTEVATFCRNGQDLWIRGPDGRQNMQAQAVALE